ncbi:hypothetical protein Tco_1136727, partial [Tanacetum coccineum]
VIQNGNSKKRILTGKDGVIRILPPVTAAEIQVVEKERKAHDSSEGLEKGYDRFQQIISFSAKGTHDGKKGRDSFYQHQEAGKQEKNQMGLLTMDDGIC